LSTLDVLIAWEDRRNAKRLLDVGRGQAVLLDIADIFIVRRAFADMCAAFLKSDCKKTPAMVKLLKKKRKSKAEQDEIEEAVRAALYGDTE